MQRNKYSGILYFWILNLTTSPCNNDKNLSFSFKNVEVE